MDESKWKKKFKGNERGGAWIHTHPAYDRAIVENHWGFRFNGERFETLREAKVAMKAHYHQHTAR